MQWPAHFLLGLAGIPLIGFADTPGKSLSCYKRRELVELSLRHRLHSNRERRNIVLIGFKLKNFRSFLGEQTFLYTAPSAPTGERTMRALSQIAIIFGPNAAGKTNFIMALRTMRELVLRSTILSEAQFAQQYDPYQPGPSAEQPTGFEIDVLLNEVRYRYSLSYDSHRITAERLLVYRTGKSQRWFERRFDAATETEEWSPFSASFHGSRDLWRRTTGPTGLFLTAAARLNSEQLGPLYRWFEHGLDIALPSDAGNLDRTVDRMRFGDFKGRILSLLQCMDVRIADVRVAEPDPAPAAKSTHIEFLYGEGDQVRWLDSIREGAGVHRLLALFGSLLDAIDVGRLLVVDEFDMNLHPLVARFLMGLVGDPCIRDSSVQLLLTSHSTPLMDPGFTRRDDIWLIELDANRASRLSPLLMSMPRRRDLVEKPYLSGRYGGVPRIGAEKIHQ
jgi:uncharacterized protein